ncbi:aminopeptidase [Leptospira sp. 2 VSF19]|uniref:Aminopeptidase n=1 Tax=Leptospira soteropolitanensis TaxID=2950025 RepID=A0AAW5VML4_9LEPT|nr:aminopeptidase [Leptospira soteropolitanensis]MCW7493971.1 aminopeptidase [Leptospira soteropolitanensis]MCW7501565.1 aminopeptidase [Leptospira soteropolitanensis]MCW7523673.1 aminopeptidase [Leptospira soteropolitanensis]MCW7527536.1 aminopeptidase [Leptospira soteropolitanensis]MCW7531390.1 aminopeptidase [Leptospira soteropolitanensis]
MPKPLPLLSIPLPCRTKKIRRIFTISLFPIFLSGCLPYLFHLGKEQSSIILGREKIEDILKLPGLDLKTKQKLNLIQEARNFAIGELALNEKGGFEYYTKLNREEIGWNVSASEALELKSYTWWFPIAGTVPYKGFFDKQMALKLEKELQSEGYDTRIRAIGGYSTLGWFSDPVLSPQLSWPDHRLVGLVFHEMAHATVYLPGDSTLNESYASYVEEKGIERYYTIKEGKSSTNLQKFKKEKLRREVTIKLLQKYANELKTLYASELDSENKWIQKRSIMVKFKEEVIQKKLVPEEKAKEFLTREWNNEDFLGALRYHSGEVSFESLFIESGENFRQFHKEVKKLFELPEENRKQFLNKIR